MPDPIKKESRNLWCPGIPERPDCPVRSTKTYHEGDVYYCIHCARIKRLRPDTTPETRAKQRQAKTGTKKGTKTTEVPVKQSFIPQEITEAMHPIDFDLESQYDLYKEVDPGKTFGNAPAILAYSQWYHSDTKTRTPQKKEDVANILGVSRQNLYVWEKTSIFKKARSEFLDDILEYGIGAEITTAVALTNAGNGSEKAIEIINKRVEKRQRDRGTKSTALDFLDEKDLAEARAIIGEKKIDKRSNAGKLASESIETMLTEGEPIDESKFN